MRWSDTCDFEEALTKRGKVGGEGVSLGLHGMGVRRSLPASINRIVFCPSTDTYYLYLDNLWDNNEVRSAVLELEVEKQKEPLGSALVKKWAFGLWGLVQIKLAPIHHPSISNISQI